jgi:hypothetical protein
MRASFLRLTSTLGLAAALAVGCNSSDYDSGSNSTGTTNASATGVWSGTDSSTELTVTALINAAGEAAFIRSDGVLFTGTADVSSNTLAVSVDGYSSFPTTFADGSIHGLGTLNGTVTTASMLSATLTFTTDGNTAIAGSWSLSYSSIANNASSTGAISGNYTDNSSGDPLAGAVLSINSNGVMTGQSASSGCVLNGSVSTNDSSHNVYEVAYSYASCTGGDAVLNGVQFTGLATLNTAQSPSQLLIAVAGASSTAKYGIVSQLSGS